MADFTQYEIPEIDPADLPFVQTDQGIALESGKMSSPNFVTGQKGWMLDADGNAEFNAGIAVDSLDIPNTTTAASFHVDTSGNTWWGSSTISGSVASISAAGIGSFSTLYISGGTINGIPLNLVSEDYEYGVFRGSSVDGLTQSATNSTITRKPVNTQMENSTGGSWSLCTDGIGMKTKTNTVQYDWDNNYNFFCRLACSVGETDTGLHGPNLGWGLLARTTSLPSSLGDNGTTMTTRHVMFFEGRDGKLYASNADGTTQKITEVASVTVTTEHNYRIEFTAATSILFYVDEVLKVTHTANIPTGSTNPPDIHFEGRIGQNLGDKIEMLLYNNYKLSII